MIAPPTNCPRLRETIHSARYFPRAPDGASVIMAPASATYQQAVPIPPIAPLRMRYYRKWRFVRHYILFKKTGQVAECSRWVCSRNAMTHPLISKLAVAVVCRPLDGERHGADDQGPLDTDLINYRTAQEANLIGHPPISTLTVIVGTRRDTYRQPAWHI